MNNFPNTSEKHRIRWYVRVEPTPEFPDGYQPHESTMRGPGWGFDARCSCGWDSKTGGAVRAEIRRCIADHKFDVKLEAAGVDTNRGVGIRHAHLTR